MVPFLILVSKLSEVYDFSVCSIFTKRLVIGGEKKTWVISLIKLLRDMTSLPTPLALLQHTIVTEKGCRVL